MNSRGDFIVLIPAGGSGTRFGGDKLSLQLGDRTVLQHSVAAFAGRDDVAEIVVACPADRLDAILEGLRDVTVTEGGDCRAASVHAALVAATASASFVAVHDAARPAVSQALIDCVFTATREHGAAVPGLPVTNTIKQVSDGVVRRTLPRDELVAVETPQAMRRDWLAGAFEHCPVPLPQVTDDVQLLELAGHNVHVVTGDPNNVKLTTPNDVDRLRERIASQA
ncbi:MAG: 2-C-methyl-D-erythritol 4-phosphate cytidylyltransferase [Planctomycetota bacterium]